MIKGFPRDRLPARCRALLACLLLAAMCVLPSLHANAAADPFDTAMELIASNDWDTALYALELATQKSVELDVVQRALLWRAAILKAHLDGDFVFHGFLYDAIYVATSPDKESFQRKRTEVFDLTMAHEARLMAVIDDLAIQVQRRIIPITLPVPCDFPTGDLEGFERRVKIGLYPGDRVVDQELRAAYAIYLPIVLSRWTGLPAERILEGMLDGSLACDVDMAAAFLDLGRLLYPTDDAGEAALTTREIECGRLCLDKVIELTEDDPYCREHLEAARLLSR